MHTKKILSLMQRISNAYLSQCAPILEEYALPLCSFHILMFLTNHPEHVTARDISSFLNIKANVISIHVNRLVEEGYLTRQVMKNDRRKVQLKTPDKAQPIVQKGLLLEKNFCEKLKSGITDENMEILGNILKQVGENADQILGKGKNNSLC